MTAPVENGIKMGEGRVHPYFDLETHYDSAAWSNTPKGTTNTQIFGEVVNHFRPGFRLDLPATAVDMSLNANVDYVWYTGLLNAQDTQASRLEAGADLAANFNKNGPVGFEVGDRFSRSDRTSNAAIAIGVISLFNEIRAGIPIKPGGGALELDPTVGYAVEFFSPIAGNTPLQDPKTFNYQNVRFGLGGRYRFLPKTAIVLDASYDLRSYFSAGNLPAQLLKAETGLAGLVSPKIALLLKLGWAQDFAGRARSLIGHGELNYFLNERSNVKFGYLRSIDPVPLFGSFGDDRGYVEANLMMAEKLRMQGYAAFDYLTYYGVARHDTSVTFSLSPEYTLTRWFKLGAAYTLSVRSSDQVTSATLNFTRHEGLLRATFQY
ncbi:MAG: outer membrane beta-barrel protein [Myxococcaceae bacterium]